MNPTVAVDYYIRVIAEEQPIHLQVTSPKIKLSLQGWTVEQIARLLADANYDSLWYGAEGKLQSYPVGEDEFKQPIYRHKDRSKTTFPIPSTAINTIIRNDAEEVVGVVTDGKIIPGILNYIALYTFSLTGVELQVMTQIKFTGIAAVLHNQLASVYRADMQAAMSRLATLLGEKSPADVFQVDNSIEA